MHDPPYPLPGTRDDGWGRSPVEEARNYAIYGAPPSKKQLKAREGLLAKGQPLTGHEAKEIRAVGLLKWIRNLQAHAKQLIAPGNFGLGEALFNYILTPFPFLVQQVVYTLDLKHAVLCLASDGESDEEVEEEERGEL